MKSGARNEQSVTTRHAQRMWDPEMDAQHKDKYQEHNIYGNARTAQESILEHNIYKFCFV